MSQEPWNEEVYHTETTSRKERLSKGGSEYNSIYSFGNYFLCYRTDYWNYGCLSLNRWR